MLKASFYFILLLSDKEQRGIAAMWLKRGRGYIALP